MFCEECGKKNPEDSMFCVHCGNKLAGLGVELIEGNIAPVEMIETKMLEKNDIESPKK